ncbi:MAG: PhoH family protein [Cyclobacteriaceae bacterium]
MATSNSLPKIFVLDTSVLLFNSECIKHFEDNDIAIPISVLEEVDNFKKGNDTLNFEARQFIRMLDELSGEETLNEWKSLGDNLGKLKVEMNEKTTPDACELFGADKADHRILNVAIQMQQEFPERTVLLVSKDINLRIKAKSINILAQDYEYGKVKMGRNSDVYQGRRTLEDIDKATIDLIYNDGGCDYNKVIEERPVPNEYFILKNGKTSILTFFNPHTDRIERVEKRAAYGIMPRNAEQVFALHAITNPDIKLVTVSGVAGTGKTLLALAGSIEQKKEFRQIYLARPIVPLSNKDIGFLPGDIKSKLNPYMEPLWDNLKTIQGQFKETDKDYKKIQEMVDQEKLMITPLAYIRGRSLSNIIFIVDEAQNLTPHEVKTIITRAGENVKIIFTGDVRQIDTPYLDTESNGLSYLIDKIHSHELHAHVQLERGERSELANVANELL